LNLPKAGKVVRKGEDEYLDFREAMDRLNQIVDAVRKKELSLEESIDMLEEAVCLANVCTENIDKNHWLKSGEDEDVDQGYVSE
jgi:exodeoxyribonuclease VII small subunit